MRVGPGETEEHLDGEVFVEVVDGAEADDEDLDFDVRGGGI